MNFLMALLVMQSKLSPIIDDYIKKTTPLNLEQSSIVDLRHQFNERQKIANASLPGTPLTLWNETIKTKQGDIWARYYRPKTDDLLPVLVFFHGGGFVFGNLDTLEGYCRELSLQTNSLIVSVDYPLAPENPFPIPHEAAYESTKQVFHNLNRLRADPDRLFVGGSSAGASLAIAVAILASESLDFKIKGQILLCPMTNKAYNTSSYHEFSKGFNLTRDQCIWFWSKISPNSENDSNPLLSPLRLKDFRNLPSSLIVTAECDPLRDDGKLFAKKLMEANVTCKEFTYPGMIHGFYSMPLELSEKKDVIHKIKNFIN